MAKIITDVAKWNAIANYNDVKKSGVQGAILKVINQYNTADSLFHTHVAGFNSVGTPIIGGYTYSYANTVEKAKKAADAFISIGGAKDIPVMWLDLEDNAVKGLGSKIIDIINVYKQAATDAKMGFGIYTGEYYYTPYLKPYAKELIGIPIWWARYPFIKEYKPTDTLPDTKYLPADIAVSGWQYTSKGKVDGYSGYIDLSVWYDDVTFKNKNVEITVNFNPFTEPVSNISLGKMGNDANWVLWYLWRFGKLVDENGVPDTRFIDGVIGVDAVQKIKEVQALLGLEADGIVGKITRATWKKIC